MTRPRTRASGSPSAPAAPGPPTYGTNLGWNAGPCSRRDPQLGTQRAALEPRADPPAAAHRRLQHCRGVLSIDPTTGTVTRNVEYDSLALAGREVRPGAVRIASTASVPSGVKSVAFVNADGSHALMRTTRVAPPSRSRSGGPARSRRYGCRPGPSPPCAGEGGGVAGRRPGHWTTTNRARVRRWSRASSAATGWGCTWAGGRLVATPRWARPSPGTTGRSGVSPARPAGTPRRGPIPA